MRQIIYILTIALLLISCAKEVNIDYSLLIQGEPIEINTTGVTYIGKITNGKSVHVDSYGFTWSDVGLQRPETITFNQEIPESGIVKFRLDRNLAPGSVYKVEFWAVNGKTKQVAQQTYNFVSKGSNPNVITDFTPKTGYAGDTITIYGAYFSTIPPYTSLTIGGIRAGIISATTEKLIATIPSSVTQNPASIIISNTTHTSKANGTYTIIKY